MAKDGTARGGPRVDFRLKIQYSITVERKKRNININVNIHPPVSRHVETVVQLINQNAKVKHHVNIGVDAEDYYRIKESE